MVPVAVEVVTWKWLASLLALGCKTTEEVEEETVRGVGEVIIMEIHLIVAVPECFRLLEGIRVAAFQNLFKNFALLENSCTILDEATSAMKLSSKGGICSMRKISFLTKPGYFGLEKMPLRRLGHLYMW